MNGDRPEVRARERATAKFGFYVHLGVYVAVMLMLILINVTTSAGYLWFIWPLLGWGLAVALHALFVFVLGTDNGIIDRLTERELRKDQLHHRG